MFNSRHISWITAMPVHNSPLGAALFRGEIANLLAVAFSKGIADAYKTPAFVCPHKDAFGGYIAAVAPAARRRSNDRSGNDMKPDQEQQERLELWNLKFGVDVSALYHDWRRGTMEAAQRFSRFATIVGIILTLTTSFNPLGWAPHVLEWTITGILFFVACVNVAELTYRFNERATEHLELYRRFSDLLIRMSRPQTETNERL